MASSAASPSCLSKMIEGLGKGLISVLSALWSQVMSQWILANAASPCLSQCCDWRFKHILPWHHWEKMENSLFFFLCSFRILTHGNVRGNMLSCETWYNQPNRNEYILKRSFSYLIIKTMGPKKSPKEFMLGEEEPEPARVGTNLSGRQIYNLIETMVPGRQDHTWAFFYFRTLKNGATRSLCHSSPMRLHWMHVI